VQLLRVSGRDAEATLTDSTPSGSPIIDTRYTTASTQVSLNFGTGDGWSYLSGGIGLGKIKTSLTSPPNDVIVVESGWLETLNYGAGVRWFIQSHWAVGFDIRVHHFNKQNSTTGSDTIPLRPRLFAAMVGVSIR
jgi:opacity protein-like surface antigen